MERRCLRQKAPSLGIADRRRKTAFAVHETSCLFFSNRRRRGRAQCAEVLRVLSAVSLLAKPDAHGKPFGNALFEEQEQACFFAVYADAAMFPHIA